MARTLEQDLERILGYLDIGDCWEWKLCLDRDGYGQTTIGLKSEGTYRKVRPHRFIYEQLVGSLQSDLVLDHLCQNRKCCNPDHLEPVTCGENIRRGVTGIVNKLKTHCPHGHSYQDAHIHRGQRHCRTCSNQRRLERYHREKGMRAA